MRDYIIRMDSITIHNFKNIEYGFLSFDNPKKNIKASILGVYGQNGSGKTALIDAIAILQYALRGQSIPSSYADYIQLTSAHSKLKFEFKVANPKTEESYTVTYEFCLRKELNDLDNAEIANDISTQIPKNKVIIFDEVLGYSYESEKIKERFMSIIDTRTEDIFVPKTKYDLLVGTDKTIFTNLYVAKILASKSSRSFIFSKELFSTVQKRCVNNFEVRKPSFVLESLSLFGKYDLFVINTANSGLISMQALPLSFKLATEEKRAVGNLALPLEKPITFPKEAIEVVEAVIRDMNIVLPQIVPGLTIDIKQLGTEILPNGETGYRIQLVSKKNSGSIPLKNESEGIKKIVSILHLLIAIYNDSSITVAVDELDAGIFEYLLGELLRIISENGKGQLIFTSHNLRPLETLDKGFIAFTTTNPKNRYIRFNNVKTNHNLRDFYYRDIVLGEQKECVYETTNNAEIAFAFREAGVANGT